MKTKIMKKLLKLIVTYVLVYSVSATFLWPLSLFALFKYVGGLPYGHLVCVLVSLFYYAISYGPRPEKRLGRPWLKLNKLWPIAHDYFPVSLKIWNGSTFSAQPSILIKQAIPRQYILAMHPHGPYPVSASLIMPQLALFGDSLGDMFENLRFAAASAVFWLPLVRDMYLFLGVIEASRRTLTHALSKGLSIAILPGGEIEQLLVCPDDSPTEDVVVPVDGFFRLALVTGTPIVPAFSFGERRSYHTSSRFLHFRLWLVKKFRIGIPWAWGCHSWFPFVPLSVPISIVIGKPILLTGLPSFQATGSRETLEEIQLFDSAITQLRERYKQAFEELFECHKQCDPIANTKMLRWVVRSDVLKAD